jgi:hypothetical protein
MGQAEIVRSDMQAIVGVPYRRTESYPVTASDIRRWAVAVHHPEPPPARYTDPERVAAGDVEAPLDFNPFAWGAARSVLTGTPVETTSEHLGVGAVEQHLGIAPPDLFHALNGGMSTEYSGTPIRPGDVITSEDSVGAYSVRDSRMGPMLLTELTASWTNQDGAPIKTHRLTLIRY